MTWSPGDCLLSPMGSSLFANPRPHAGAGRGAQPLEPTSGCAFNPRCPHANDRCRCGRPVLKTIAGLKIACHAVEEGRLKREDKSEKANATRL